MSVERCDTCGRFHSLSQPGSSWGQYWSYDMSGTPDLHDPRFRCSVCTEAVGEVGTNCHGEGYAGRIPVAGGAQSAPSPGGEADPG